jgi:homoserine O-succinyltransferase
MNNTGQNAVRLAILDLYEGKPNQGMRCIRSLIREWADTNSLDLIVDEFDVRLNNQLPDNSYDIYISTGGPGDPLVSRFEDWDISWTHWLDRMERWNNNPENHQKKHVLFICHSFQLAARYFNAGVICKRRSTAFGVFPIHMLEPGRDEPLFEGLPDPFYAVDSRDYQVVQPNHSLLDQMGARILCIEKARPHVPYERAVMGIRFNEFMVGTQFHPEADAKGMSIYLQTEEKRTTVIENYGQEKLDSMLEQLEDPDKIMCTQAHVVPNFLNQYINQVTFA